MDIPKALDKNNPFGALIGASTLIAAILYVSGFSFKWSYYYNFGVQHLVFQQSIQAFLIASLELIRQPQSLWLTFLFIICPLILLNIVIALLQRAYESSSQTSLGKVASHVIRVVGLHSPLVVDAIRAVVIIYACFMVSSELGYNAFRENIVDSRSNPLPAVTLVFDQEQTNGEIALACGALEDTSLTVIGDPRKIRLIQESYRACNSEKLTWRLLYRDENAIYIFASQPQDMLLDGRPLTMVIPNDGKIYLVME